MEILYILGSLFLICIVGYYLIYSDRKRDRKNLDKDWENFLKSAERKDVSGLNKYEKNLIWNKYLKSTQLDKLIETVDLLSEKSPGLEKLKNLAFNKKLHYDRTLPYPGSSGGKKQSW